MSSWNTAGQMPQPEAPEGQQPGQMPGAMPQRQEPEEEENKTASDVSTYALYHSLVKIEGSRRYN